MRAPIITREMLGTGFGWETWMGLYDIRDYGADPTGVLDSTVAIQIAIEAALALPYKPAIYVPTGVFKLSDELTVQQDAANVAGGFTLIGNGYYSVLYQTGVGKNILNIIRHQGVATSFWIQNVTIKDISLFGIVGAGTGLYLEGVHRSVFSNIQIATGGRGLHLKGCILNNFHAIRATATTILENPITGVAPGTLTDGFYTESITADPDTMTCNANNFTELVVEGALSDGLHVVGGYANRYQGCIENIGGDGIYCTEQDDEFVILGMEGITGDSLHLVDSYFNTFYVTDVAGNLNAETAAANLFKGCRFDTGTLDVNCYDNMFIRNHFLTSFTDNSFQSSSVLISHVVAAVAAETYFGRSVFMTSGILASDVINGSLVWDPGNLVDGAGETSLAFSVPGAAFGDFVLVSAPYDLQGITCNGYVDAVSSVRVRLQNETGGAIDLGSGTWNVKILKE